MMSLEFRKKSKGMGLQTLNLTMRKKTVLGRDKDGDAIESCVVERAGPKLPDTQQKIAELLWSGPLRNMEICDALNMDKVMLVVI